MRILFFVSVFLCTGLVSFAQDKSPEKLFITTEKDFALANTILPGQPYQVYIAFNKSGQQEKADSVSIHKYRNTKVKRALSFMTKGDRPKLA